MKAHFYRLTPHRPNDDSFDRCMHALHQRFNGQDGIYIECDAIHLRIDNYQRSDEFCTGDVIRQQRDDIPPTAPDGASLQPSLTPVGHRTAFLYHYPTRVLVYQVNKPGAGVATLLKCVARELTHDGFMHVAVVSSDTMDDLMDGNVRRMTVKFAAPENMAIADRRGSDLNNLDTMRRLFGAPSMEVTCGFDTPKRGSLNVDAVVNFIRQVYDSPVRPKKIQVKQEGASDLLDLLGKKLTYMDENVQLDSGDIRRHYLARRRFLEEALAEKRDYLLRLFRVAA